MKVSSESGMQIKNLKYFCKVCTNSARRFQRESHLAKPAALCYIITRKGNPNLLSSIPGSNIGAIKHGECTAGPKYTGGQQPPCRSHIRDNKNLKCVLRKKCPVGEAVLRNKRKRGNQDVRYQEFNEMTLDCRRGEREKIAAVKGHFVF